MKKILSLCLAIVTLLSCVCVVNASEAVVSSVSKETENRPLSPFITKSMEIVIKSKRMGSLIDSWIDQE